MLAIDIRVTEIRARHRISLFKLMRIEVGNLEPVYSKITKVLEFNSTSTSIPSQGDLSFGSIILVDDKVETMQLVTGEFPLRFEVYDDQHGPLELICAGDVKVSLISCTPGHPQMYFDIRERSFTKIAQICDSIVPMRHFAQGQFHISAGELRTCITVYRVDLGPSSFYNPSTNNYLRENEDSTNTLAERMEVPVVLTAEEINHNLGYNTDQPDAISGKNEDPDEVDTTRDDSYLEDLYYYSQDNVDDDNNSVDAFVDLFLRTRSPPHHRQHRRSYHDSDTDRSDSPPPPPPLLPPHSLSSKPPQRATGNNIKSQKQLRNEKPKIDGASSNVKNRRVKPHKVSPHLIGAAADRGRWLFARPTFP